MNMRDFSKLTAAVLAAVLAGCAPKPPPPPPVPAKPAPPYTWNDGAGKGSPRIEVDLGKQRAYFFRGNVLVGETKCSSGKRGFATQTGMFAVIQKDPNHESNLYGSFINGEEIGRAHV